jgi:drug/metabolite transporter (DMT)-like permease
MRTDAPDPVCEGPFSMSPIFALGASLTYGIADFTGALAARRTSALTVTLSVQLVGLLFLLPFLGFLPGTFSWPAVLIGGASGTAGTAGLVLYLRAMARGPIGVISPLAAASGAVMPVAWGSLVLGDRLSSLQFAGVVLALASVFVVAWVPGTAVGAAAPRSVLAGLGAGLLFGSFFVALDATPADSGMWPLVGARVASAVGIVLLLRVVSRPAHPGPALGLIVLSGASDMTANVLFLLATRGGLLSVSALLSSLYPVVALLLARRFLAERIHRIQAAGVVGALVATALLVSG